MFWYSEKSSHLLYLLSVAVSHGFPVVVCRITASVQLLETVVLQLQIFTISYKTGALPSLSPVY